MFAFPTGPITLTLYVLNKLHLKKFTSINCSITVPFHYSWGAGTRTLPTQSVTISFHSCPHSSFLFNSDFSCLQRIYVPRKSDGYIATFSVGIAIKRGKRKKRVTAINKHLASVISTASLLPHYVQIHPPYIFF